MVHFLIFLGVVAYVYLLPEVYTYLYMKRNFK